MLEASGRLLSYVFVVAARVIEDATQVGSLEGCSRIRTSEQLADEHESVTESAHISQQVPHRVPRALTNEDVVRKPEDDISLS